MNGIPSPATEALRPGRGVGPLLGVRGLTMRFPIRRGLFGRVRGHVHAVEGVDLDVFAGETLGLVGESGCGKTTTGRCILRLLEPTGGTVEFDGRTVWGHREVRDAGEDGRTRTVFTGLDRAGMRELRRQMQIIFQDPQSSLNPRMTVEAMVGEGLVVHRLAATRAERRAKVANLIERVGLPQESLDRYPHEFSGGQRQRIGIARALAVGPRFIVCDEPVSALDVSVQAQIVNLLLSLQEELGISYLFISHDLLLVEHVAHRVAVMYLGQIVELADSGLLYENPAHPYTRALFSAIPEIDGGAGRTRVLVPGEPPSPVNPPPGCRFHPRCPRAFGRCSEEAPPLFDLGGGHLARCFLVENEAAEAPVPGGAARGP